MARELELSPTVQPVVDVGADGSRGRAVFTLTNVTLGTDKTGIALEKGRPMFQFGAATAAVTKGNRFNPLINWTVPLGLLKFELKAGMDFTAGIAGPSVAFAFDTDLAFDGIYASSLMKHDRYNAGFFAGALLTLGIDFKLFYYAPWDCQWHVAFQKSATVPIDLIDLLIKIFAFAYKKLAAPKDASAAAQAKFEQGVDNKKDVAVALQGMWNFLESAHYTYACSNTTAGKVYGSFDFGPAYTIAGTWSPWSSMGPAMSYLIDTVASKVGVGMRFVAGVEVVFPGEVYANGFAFDGKEYRISNSLRVNDSEGRKIMNYHLVQNPPGAGLTAAPSTVKMKVNIVTDCVPRLFAGIEIRAGFLGSWTPRWEISLWSILGIRSPARWQRDDWIAQARSLDPDTAHSADGYERQVAEMDNPFSLPPVEFVFEPPVAEAVV